MDSLTAFELGRVRRMKSRNWVVRTVAEAVAVPPWRSPSPFYEAEPKRRTYSAFSVG